MSARVPKPFPYDFPLFSSLLESFELTINRFVRKRSLASSDTGMKNQIA